MLAFEILNTREANDTNFSFAGAPEQMPTDLGLTHEMVTDLFPQPKSAAEWEAYMLTSEQLADFKEQGFISGIRLLNDAQITALTGELAEMVNPDHDGHSYFYEYHSNESTNPETTLFHALGAWRVRPAFHDIPWNPAFLMAAYQLLGTGFRLFHDQLFSKPAKHGGVVAWHQDYSYWTWTKPIAHLTCWIALDDVDTENGCLYYVPGSHRWGLIEKPGLAGDMDAVQDVLSAEQVDQFHNKTPIVMKRGEASFHHPIMMHGSYENRSNRQRRATVINVFADGVLSDIDPQTIPQFGKYPVVPRGEPMAGDYYPLLLDPPQTFNDWMHSIPTIEHVECC